MLSKILKKYSNQINGIIQVGAHIGQQVNLFLENTDKNIYLFEPQEEAYKLLEKYELHSNVFCFNFGLGNKNGIENIYVSDIKEGVSSSLLEPKLHKDFFPEYTFSKKTKITIKKFSSLYDIVGNFLVIDVQGYELEVLRGFERRLKEIDFIFSEINLVEFYQGGVLINELDDYLDSNNFIRVKTSLVSNIPMGDALYVNKNLVSKYMITFYKFKSLLETSKFFIFLNYFKDLKKLNFHLKNIFKKYLSKKLG